jgi:hypothetical protein
MPEAAATSAQIHLQVSPEDFAAYWNAAQAIAGIQLAVGANSPFLFGKRLVPESRVPLFEQATDTRSEELKAQGVRPRVWFGERWITSIFDLFEENSRYFAALLPVVGDEDPAAVLDAGGIPELAELQLHNGTIYRWNLMANTAFFAGLVRALAEQDRPVWSQLSYRAATANFAAGVRSGIEAEVEWPGLGQVRARDLVLRKLLPLAAEGLRRWEVDSSEADRYLQIIERRCLDAVNGASWQTAAVARREAAGDDRSTALRGMLGRYRELMTAGEPVHLWPDD